MDGRPLSGGLLSEVENGVWEVELFGWQNA